MKQRSDFIHYNEAVSLYLKREIKKLNAFMSKGLLTHNERGLIKARLLNLEGKTSQACELLESQKPTNLFLRAQKENVLSSIYDKLSQYQNAAVSNQKAINLYLQLNDRDGLFVSYLNLAINFSRLSLEELFEFNWKLAHNYIQSKENENSLIRAKVSYLAKRGKLEEALSIIQEITQSPGEYNNKIAFLNLEADILFGLKRYKESLDIYSSLFKKTKSLTRFRINYEYQVTYAFVARTKLRQIPEDFPRTSEYYYLWNSLIHLQNGDPELAHKSWLELVKMNPDKYMPEFRYKDVGDTNSHFSQYYDYLKGINAGILLNPFKPGSHSYNFVDILKSSQAPLRKEVLIERLWNLPYSPDLDSRFYKLVERVRKNTNLIVSMRNSTYKIQSKVTNYL